MIFPFWHLMRELALWRHWLIVVAAYPSGPKRDAAWARHVGIVAAVYDF